MGELRERESKFDVDSDWVLPDLAPLAPDGGSVATHTVELTSAYLDTPSRDLLSAGATLRRRTGDADTGWHLKVLDGDSRVEVRADLDGAGVPKELRELVAGVRSGEPLRPLVTMTTVRRAHSIVAADGTVLAEIADDQVSATVFGPRRRTVGWREIEVEQAAGDEALLTRAGRVLVKAGAAPSTSTSKVARALQRPGGEGSADLSLGGLIRAYVSTQVDALLQRDIDLRRARDVAHPTRVAIRRIRSVLHVFFDLFDPDRATALNSELSWFSGLLGEVRDRDVLRDHLSAAVAALPAEVVIGPVAERIEAMLTAEREAAVLALSKAMKSPRYFALIRELKAWRDDPAFRNGHEPTGGVGSWLRAAAAKVSARLRAAEKLDATTVEAAAAMHRARKAAKRARYIAELARPRLGGKAKSVIAEATATQDRLGGHQDSVIAAQFLLRAQRAADAAAGESPFTYGVLWAQEHANSTATAQSPA
ncbi:CYTH and CHAD domain-containing protein [Jatrophihabitans sp.]|uniref:CYTH and CHAD domain-containing protein n=1 Tax=Jatrophihabitans sp. TaxID=1932789 RepID=UPI0030C6F06A|nr:hypothetical protein [Jatrophihabitans sp.]